MSQHQNVDEQKIEFALVLSDTRIETTLKSSFLDAGGISNRRGRTSLTLGCSTPRFFHVSSVFVVSLATTRLAALLRVWCHQIRPFLGVPLSSSSTASFIFRKRRVSTYPPTTNAKLPTGDYQPHFGERIVRRYGSGFYRSDLPPTPRIASQNLSLKQSRGESFNPRRPLPRFLTPYPPDRRTEPALLPSLDSARPSAHRCSHIAVRLFHRSVISILYAEVGQQRLVMGFISPSVFNCNILSPVSQPTEKWEIFVYLAIFWKFLVGSPRFLRKRICAHWIIS
ncbi:unnamed protein product [Brassica napus]|uniref:(rape) hypothetical protein n=1 Tax=Brassica napus TaxID=3708 RepID=A0A816TZ72_BRANA|nr:unnamed protein product [Brassica napus]